MLTFFEQWLNWKREITKVCIWKLETDWLCPESRKKYPQSLYIYVLIFCFLYLAIVFQKATIKWTKVWKLKLISEKSQMYSRLVAIVFVDVHVPVVFTSSPNFDTYIFDTSLYRDIIKIWLTLKNQKGTLLWRNLRGNRNSRWERARGLRTYSLFIKW